jgi:Ring finger domain
MWNIFSMDSIDSDDDEPEVNQIPFSSLFPAMSHAHQGLAPNGQMAEENINEMSYDQVAHNPNAFPYVQPNLQLVYRGPSPVPLLPLPAGAHSRRRIAPGEESLLSDSFGVDEGVVSLNMPQFINLNNHPVGFQRNRVFNFQRVPMTSSFPGTRNQFGLAFSFNNQPGARESEVIFGGEEASHHGPRGPEISRGPEGTQEARDRPSHQVPSHSLIGRPDPDEEEEKREASLRLPQPRRNLGGSLSDLVLSANSSMSWLNEHDTHHVPPNLDNSLNPRGSGAPLRPEDESIPDEVPDEEPEVASESGGVGFPLHGSVQLDQVMRSNLNFDLALRSRILKEVFLEGKKPEVIMAMEKNQLELSEEEKQEVQGECVICYLEYVERNKMKAGCPGNHVFHALCLAQWVKEKNAVICPLCKWTRA